MALPLVISTSSWTLMYFIDRMFLFWYSADALGAALPSGMFNFTLMCVPLGVASYATTFVSQYFGAGHHERIGLAVWQGVWLGVLTIPLMLITIPLAPWIFAMVGHAAEIQLLETTYFQVLAAGAGAMVVGAALEAFFIGRGSVAAVMVINCLAAGLNIGLDWCWIFGHFGFPAAGMTGAAWATVCAQWFKVALCLVIFLRPAYRVQFGTLVGCRFDRRLFGRLIWFGSPNGLHYLLEVGWFTVFILLVGRLGTLPLTATNLAFNVNALAFMPVLGIGMAVSTIVGQRLGQERPDLAARATVTAFWIGLAYMAAISSVYVLTPDLLLWGYASRADPESFRQLRDLTVILLRFVAAYCIFDTLAIVFVSAIKGAGDTQFVLRTMLVMSALPLVACYLVVEVFELGLFWAWGVVTVYVWVLGLIFLARFLQGRWRDMRVIESEFRPDELSEIVDPPLPATAEV